MRRDPVKEEAARVACEGARCIALRTRRLARLVTRLYEQALRDHGITVAQFTLLGALTLSGRLAPGRLGRMLDLEKSTLSRNVRLLESAGYLRIDGSPRGNGQVVRVTDRGRRVLVKAFPAWRQAQARVVDALGEGVVAKLDSMAAALGGYRPQGVAGLGAHPKQR